MAWQLLECPVEGSAVKRIGRQRDYVRAFKLVSDAGETTGYIEARNAAGVPVLGSFFEDPITGTVDPSAICQEVRAAMLGGCTEGTAYLLTCSYRSIGAQPRRDEPLDNLQDAPWDRPYSLRGRTTHREKALRRGKFLGAFRLDNGSSLAGAMDSRVLASTAGEPLSLTPGYDGGELEWEIQVNLPEADWSAAIAGQWKNAVNNATWNGLPAYTVKIGDITFDRVWEGAVEGTAGELYWDVTYRLEYNADYWYFEFEDVGSLVINSDGDLSAATVNGQPAYVYLNGQGEPLSPSEIDGGQFSMLRYLPHDWPLMNFSSLPGGPFTI